MGLVTATLQQEPLSGSDPAGHTGLRCVLCLAASRVKAGRWGLGPEQAALILGGAAGVATSSEDQGGPWKPASDVFRHSPQLTRVPELSETHTASVRRPCLLTSLPFSVSLL